MNNAIQCYHASNVNRPWWVSGTRFPQQHPSCCDNIYVIIANTVRVISTHKENVGCFRNSRHMFVYKLYWHSVGIGSGSVATARFRCRRSVAKRRSWYWALGFGYIVHHCAICCVICSRASQTWAQGEPLGWFQEVSNRMRNSYISLLFHFLSHTNQHVSSQGGPCSVVDSLGSLMWKYWWKCWFSQHFYVYVDIF